jgi:hypothetical protein
MLTLETNKIFDDGAQHLAEALQYNTVRLVLDSPVLYTPVSFNTDTYNTESHKE